MTQPVRTNRYISRTTALIVAAVVGLAPATAWATPAAAGATAPVGYVRLAHLSPDTPAVDVYLSKIGDTSFSEQVFPHVGYGVMSKYLPLPLGTYAVAMREQGAASTAAPVLTTQVTVDAGGAYTVAGVGRFAGLGLQVFVDDLSRPEPGKAKVRVIQASVAVPVMDVTLPNGTPIAHSVTFASTTAYQLVDQGNWALKLKPNGSNSSSTVSAYLGGGSVYSLLVLDGARGLKVEVRADARGGELAPDGGVDTGAGATSGVYLLTLLGSGAILVAGLVLLALRLRRLRRLAQC